MREVESPNILDELLFPKIEFQNPLTELIVRFFELRKLFSELWIRETKSLNILIELQNFLSELLEDNDDCSKFLKSQPFTLRKKRNNLVTS